MIQTVTGAIESANIGKVLMHEHISCASASFCKAFGNNWLDTEKLKALSCETLNLVKQRYGLGLFVDGTPIDLSRNALLLKEISELTGVKIVASSGFYYLPSIETINNSPKELASLLVRECLFGIEGTDIKPGILKCATGIDGITSDNLIKLSAMAEVQRQTHLPLYVHCEHNGDIALEQIKLLTENGADIERIIIGHCAHRHDEEYLHKILSTGCYICMDQCHCFDTSIASFAGTLVNLCKKGFASRILIANDYCIHSDFCQITRNGLHLTAEEHASGLGFVFDNLGSSFIELGGSYEDWNALICDNPMRALDV